MKLYISEKIKQISLSEILFEEINGLSLDGDTGVNFVVDLVNDVSRKSKLPITVFETDSVCGDLYLRPSIEGDVIESRRNTVEGVETGEVVLTDERNVRAIFTKQDSYLNRVKENSKNLVILIYSKDGLSGREEVEGILDVLAENIVKKVSGVKSNIQSPDSISSSPELYSGRRILSGIRPSNLLHLGNYLGAIKGMIEIQKFNNYQTFYMVADSSAITTPYDKNELANYSRNVILDYLACGIDPKKSVLFVQSHVSEHVELAYLLSSACSLARLQHLPTFKDKVKQYPDDVTLALLTYPILMAGGILLYKSDYVPVGIDQEPHLEIAREMAKKMNDKYGTTFPEPKRFATKGEYVPSLTGEGKMSKSVEGSSISLVDDLEIIKKKLSRAPTDSGKGDKIPEDGGIANLLKFVELFEGVEKRENYESKYLGEGIRYGDLKEELANAIYAELRPIQEKRKYFEENPEEVDRIIEEGAIKARKIASETLKEVKKKMGFI